jgi:predicted transcriptional regulator
MKDATLTLRLPPELDRRLERVAKRSGRSKSEIAREALRKQLSLEVLRDVRRELVPAAEARGIVSDEDVFDLIS